MTITSPKYECFIGDTWVFPLTFTNPVLDGSNVPATAQNLTGYTFTAYLLVASKPPIEVTVSPQSEDLLLADGKVQIVIDPSITATIPADPASVFSSPDSPVRVRVEAIDPSGHIKSTRIPIRVLAI